MARALAILALPFATLAAKEKTSVAHIQFFNDAACADPSNSGSSDPGLPGWGQSSQYVKTDTCHKTGPPGQEKSFKVVCSETSVTLSYFSDAACSAAIASPGDSTELLMATCEMGSDPLAVAMKAVLCDELSCEPCTESCMGATYEKMTCEALTDDVGKDDDDDEDENNDSGNTTSSDSHVAHGVVPGVALAALLLISRH